MTAPKSVLAETNQLAQAAELHRLVALCVTRDDEPASAANKLVDGQVLKVAAIADVDVTPPVIGETEEFRSQLVEAEAESALLPGVASGIREPPAQANVEHR